MSPCSSSRDASSRASDWNDRSAWHHPRGQSGFAGQGRFERVGPLGPLAVQPIASRFVLDPAADQRVGLRPGASRSIACSCASLDAITAA